MKNWVNDSLPPPITSTLRTGTVPRLCTCCNSAALMDAECHSWTSPAFSQSKKQINILSHGCEPTYNWLVKFQKWQIEAGKICIVQGKNYSFVLSNSFFLAINSGPNCTPWNKMDIDSNCLISKPWNSTSLDRIFYMWSRIFNPFKLLPWSSTSAFSLD